MSTQPNAITADPSVGLEPEIVNPEVVESPATTEDPVEPDTAAQPEAELEPGAQPEETPSEREDGRKLPAYVRELKETNPEAYKRAKAEFFDLDARRSVHPTVKAAREEHELIVSSGGAQGIAKLREDGQFFKSAAQQFLKGDPAFVQDLWDEDPIAAALHVPNMLELYKAKDTAGYRTTVAQLWDTEFNAVGFDNGLKQLLAAIDAGDKESARQLAEGFQKWKESISGVARQGPSAREKALLAERASRHEGQAQAEKDEFLKSYRTDATNAVVEEGAKVFDSFFKGRKIDPEDRTDLLREAFRAANAIVLKDEEYIKQREAHLAAGDSAAALRLTKSRFAQELPNAVKRIARRYGMFSGPAKPAPTNGGQPPKPGAGAPPQGFVNVNQRPSMDEIDTAATAKLTGSYQSTILSGRAVLKNGRKVSWAHLKKAS